MDTHDYPRTESGPSTFGIATLVVMLVVAAGGLAWVWRAPTEEPPEHLVVPTAETEPVQFSHEPMDRVCAQFTDDMGMVDYAALKDDPDDLISYLSQVKAVSPHSNFATFPGENEALAYWINAYNAWMMKAVIDNYPLDSVQDIEPPVFNDELAVCGGEEMSLNFIENEIIRKEFEEPRIHFAVNCASMGCPWLPQEAFFPDRLDDQLERETRRFFAAASHLKVAPEESAVYLSPILKWYSEDFTEHIKRIRRTTAPQPRAGSQRHGTEPTVLDYVRLYAPEDTPEITGGMQVRWQTYGWQLNDQGAPWADMRGDFRPPPEGGVSGAPG
ncbi:MAG: DUF547 domain-containing protein [Armatimonadia bacterium]|nr:DUF547 domain-containing protein [Armatimonadia bacterium]